MQDHSKSCSPGAICNFDVPYSVIHSEEDGKYLLRPIIWMVYVTRVEILAKIFPV